MWMHTVCIRVYNNFSIAPVFFYSWLTFTFINRFFAVEKVSGTDFYI